LSEIGDLIFVRLAFSNALTAAMISLHRINTVNFSPETPEISTGLCVENMAKIGISRQISHKLLVRPHQIFRISKTMGEDDKSNIRFAVAQWMLLW